MSTIIYFSNNIYGGRRAREEHLATIDLLRPLLKRLGSPAVKAVYARLCVAM
ncbi:UNVERIFIED_CONTAM: hypothetical protein FKN15_067199 [Acipenser sinensis]